MGGLASSLYDLIEGNPTEKEQADLGQYGNYAAGVGEGLTTAGAGEELGILSGDPTKIAQVEAPEISSQQKQIEQQNLENANFGGRSGGTNASTQAADAAGRANIIDLTGNLVGNTANAAVGQGAGLLGQASSDQQARAQMAAARQAQTASDVGGVVQGAGELAMDIAGGFGGGGGAPPTSAPETLFDAQNPGAPSWDSLETVSADPNLLLQ